MSYTIAIYRGRLEPTPSVLHFFTSLTLFPHLVAGPIMRASELQPQLVGTPVAPPDAQWEGLRLIVGGFFKKMVIADNLAPLVNKAFSGQPIASPLYWWIVIVAFAYQIYCDFSGYSDIARGLARWMGYRFTMNFDHPYVSASTAEFWRRWHMSLSTWFRDYVYIPLGGSRKGRWREYRNLWITMLVSGLWHGAAWTFLVWAALHSFYLTVERITRWPERLASLPLGIHLSQVITFLLALVAWVFFRAESIAQGVRITGLLFHLRGFTWAGTTSNLDRNALPILAVAIGRQVWWALRPRLAAWTGLWRAADRWEPVGLVVLATACVYLRGPGSNFIYFQF
jgi:alginate O-acetyltransferase complex protein AlgI